MKIKNKLKVLSFSISSGIFSLIFGLMLQGTAHAASNIYKWTGAASATAGLSGCTLNCMSVYGNWDLSTDGGTTYAVATSGQVPGAAAGDSIVFDNSLENSSQTIKNDNPSLSIANFTSQGSQNYQYTLTGNGMSISGGFINPSTARYIYVNIPVTFTASQTFGTQGHGNQYSLNQSITIGSGSTLTVASLYSTYLPSLNGSGNIIFGGPGAGVNDPNYRYTYNGGSISGDVEIQSGVEFSLSTSLGLGTANITIDNGGQLETNYSSPMTLANNITVSGNGSGVSNQGQGAIVNLYGPNRNSNNTMTLTGNITLNGDATFGSDWNYPTTFNLTGTVNKNGHFFNTVAAVQPYYGATVVQINGTVVAGGTSSTSSTTKAPKAPNTGSELVSSHAVLPAITVISIAGALMVISRKLKKATVRK